MQSAPGPSGHQPASIRMDEQELAPHPHHPEGHHVSLEMEMRRARSPHEHERMRHMEDLVVCDACGEALRSYRPPGLMQRLLHPCLWPANSEELRRRLSVSQHNTRFYKNLMKREAEAFEHYMRQREQNFKLELDQARSKEARAREDFQRLWHDVNRHIQTLQAQCSQQEVAWKEQEDDYLFRLQAATDKLRELEARNENLHEVVRALSEDVQSSKQEVAGLTCTVGAKEQALHDKHSEIELLEERLYSANADVDRLMAELEEAKSLTPGNINKPTSTAPVDFEIGFGVQDQAALLNSLAIAGERLAALLFKHHRAEVPRLLETLAQPVYKLLHDVPAQHKPDVLLAALTHAAIGLALELASDVTPARQKLDAMMQLAQDNLPSDSCRSVRTALIQVQAAFNRSLYLAGVQVVRPTGCGEVSALERQVQHYHKQMLHGMAEQLGPSNLSRDMLLPLVQNALQITLLRRTLRAASPECAVVCGGHVGKEWSEGTMEPPVKEIPVEGLSRPTVLACLRPSLQFCKAPESSRDVSVKAQVVCLVPAARVTRPPPAPPQKHTGISWAAIAAWDSSQGRAAPRTPPVTASVTPVTAKDPEPESSVARADVSNVPVPPSATTSATVRKERTLEGLQTGTGQEPGAGSAGASDGPGEDGDSDAGSSPVYVSRINSRDSSWGNMDPERGTADEGTPEIGTGIAGEALASAEQHKAADRG